MALGLKELKLKQNVENRVVHLRETHKAWMKPEFKIDVTWETFEGFAATVENSHAVEGEGAPGGMINWTTDIIRGAYDAFKDLGDAGKDILNAKFTGIRVQADDTKELNVSMEGSTVICHVPKNKGGSWSKGADEMAAWKKILRAYAEN